MSLFTIEKIIKRSAKYSADRYGLAEVVRFINKYYVKPQNYSVVMGDGCYWWVVTNREAGILRKNGYEVAY